jgi:hypothetical protein
MYKTEDGVECLMSEFWKYRTEDFWNDGWEIFIEQPTEPNFEETEESDYQCCDHCDLPDACADFGCAIKNGIKRKPLDFI